MAAMNGGGVGQILAGAFLGAWSAMCAGAVSQIIASAGGGAASQAIGGAFYGSLISGAATGARGRNLAQGIIISTVTAFAFAALGPAEGAEAGGVSTEQSQEIKQDQTIVRKEIMSGGGDLEKATQASHDLFWEAGSPQALAESFRPPTAFASWADNISYLSFDLNVLGAGCLAGSVVQPEFFGAAVGLGGVTSVLDLGAFTLYSADFVASGNTQSGLKAIFSLGSVGLDLALNASVVVKPAMFGYRYTSTVSGRYIGNLAGAAKASVPHLISKAWDTLGDIIQSRY